MQSFPQCLKCKNLIKGDGPKCKAFPSNIPTKILLNEHNHEKPYKGDHGIQFEPIKEPSK